MLSDRGCSIRRDAGAAHMEEIVCKTLNDFKKFSTGLYVCLSEIPENWEFSLNGSLRLADTHVEDVDSKMAHSTMLSLPYTMITKMNVPPR